MASAATETIDASGFHMVSGTPDQVRRRLENSEADQVVALTLEHGDEKTARFFAETVFSIAPLVSAALARSEQESLETIVGALVPRRLPPPHLLVEARMNGEVRRAVLESGDWLTAAQVAEIAGFKSQNPSAQPNKWKKERRIFALRLNGSDYYPGYALDPDTHYRPAKGLPAVLEALGEGWDDWSLAVWFASVNSFLDGKIPKDLVLSAPDQVLAAAQDEAAGVLHG